MPAPPGGSSAPTLSELLHEVEVAARVGVPDELARQLGLHSGLFDSLVGDAGVTWDDPLAGKERESLRQALP